MTEWRNKKVEQFSPEDYDKFWEKQYLMKEVTYVCQICGDEIKKRNMIQHMESNHDEKYERHNKDVEKRIGEAYE